MDNFVSWDSAAPKTTAVVEACGHFNARGMRRVYGRGDIFGRNHNFQMDIWMDRRGRLFMRCWSRYVDIDWRSFKIKGINSDGIPKPDKKLGFVDCWLPKAVRDVYEEWITAEF